MPLMDLLGKFKYLMVRTTAMAWLLFVSQQPTSLAVAWHCSHRCVVLSRKLCSVGLGGQQFPVTLAEVRFAGHYLNLSVQTHYPLHQLITKVIAPTMTSKYCHITCLSQTVVWRRYLGSGALSFRAGLFREWFDEWMKPFDGNSGHYIPVAF